MIRPVEEDTVPAQPGPDAGNGDEAGSFGAAARALVSIDRGTAVQDAPVALEEALAELTGQVQALHPPAVVTVPTGPTGRLDPDAAEAALNSHLNAAWEYVRGTFEGA